MLERSGITHDTTVIAYGDYGATGALIFWLLKTLGHEKVLVLNGGRRKWLLDDRPMTQEASIITPTSYHAKVPDPRLRAFYEEVYNALGRPDCVLLDVRSDKEYTGEWFMSEPPSKTERAGHIPGAVHINYELTLNDDGTFKSFEELDALYRDKNITPELEVIPYCAIGGRSGYTWFVLKYLLGYPNVRNYDGSWNEWSHVTDSPIE